LSLKSPVALVLGARLGVAAPVGQLPGEVFIDTGEAPVRFSDLAGAGGEFELRAGASIVDRFGLWLVFSGQSFKEKNAVAAGRVEPGSPSSSSWGLTASVGTPRGELGGYFEAGFLLARSLTVPFAYNDLLPGECSAEVILSGNGLRLGGGVNIPLSDVFHLTPYGTIGFGGFTSGRLDDSSGCYRKAFAAEGAATERRIGDSPTSASVSLGVGLEYFIGGH
jgi:hypothetical protein